MRRSSLLAHLSASLLGFEEYDFGSVVALALASNRELSWTTGVSRVADKRTIESQSRIEKSDIDFIVDFIIS